MRLFKTVFSIIALSLGIIIIISSFFLGISHARFDIGPAVYPRILGVLMAIFSVIMFVEAFVCDNKQEETKIFSVKLLIIMVGMLVYGLLLRPLGFILTTAIAIAIMMITMGVRRKRLIISFSLIFPMAIYFGFSLVLRVPLPMGVLAFILDGIYL